MVGALREMVIPVIGAAVKGGRRRALWNGLQLRLK
jgi:hypothetical protein